MLAVTICCTLTCCVELHSTSNRSCLPIRRQACCMQRHCVLLEYVCLTDTTRHELHKRMHPCLLIWFACGAIVHDPVPMSSPFDMRPACRDAALLLHACSTLKFGGFDPLFWIHHTMIDRALWLYQNNRGGWEVNAFNGEQPLFAVLSFGRYAWQRKQHFLAQVSCACW